MQLENLPGYATGEVPPHLMKLKVELEKTFANLEKKNELLINSMAKNFGKTQQDLPNFRLPAIGPQVDNKGMADPFDFNSLYESALNQQND